MYKNLHRRDKKMTDTFEGDSYEEESIILESKVKAALKVLGRKNVSENIKTKTMAYRLGTFSIHPNSQERRCQRVQSL